LEWNAPTKIKLIRELTFLLASNLLQHIIDDNCAKIYSAFRPMLVMVNGVFAVKFES